MARGEQDASSCFTHADHMAGRRSTENATLADDKLTDAIRSTNFGDELSDFRVPVTAIAAND
jgi:hypothetical protein